LVVELYVLQCTICSIFFWQINSQKVFTYVPKLMYILYILFFLENLYYMECVWFIIVHYDFLLLFETSIYPKIIFKKYLLISKTHHTMPLCYVLMIEDQRKFSHLKYQPLTHLNDGGSTKVFPLKFYLLPKLARKYAT